MNLIICLFDRCYRICSSRKFICDEFEQIKTMLSTSGCPKYVLDKCMREFFFYRQFTTKPLPTIKKDRISKKIFIRMQFLGALSVQICNEPEAFLRKHTDDKA